jgi:hypothetical protein
MFMFAIIKKSFKQIVVLSALLSIVGSAASAQAANLLINPPLIDHEMSARDIITKNVVLTNHASYRVVIFATVNEISVNTNGEIKEFITPSMTDQTSTVTSWIEVTRARLEIDPGATTTIPVTIRVNPNAKPGTYYAFVGFNEASNQPEAEAAVRHGDGNGTVVKVTIRDKKNDLLRISNFLVDRIIFLKNNRDITIEVQNNGDADSAPVGEVIFYNSRGEEVSSAKVNEAGTVIPQGETRTLTVQIPFYDKLGRFKANVKLDYGVNQKASIFDTTQFFMIPLKIMIALVFLAVLLSFLATHLLRRAFYDELHDEDDGKAVALFVRNDREHEIKDHDIHITKN